MSLKASIEALLPALVKAAQGVLDGWDQDEDGLDDELGEGGVCDRVSEAMTSVLYSIPGVEVVDGGHDGDDHVYAIVYDEVDAFAVDIPPGVYEVGGGYSWRKRDGVVLSLDDVIVEPVRRQDVVDPDLDRIASRVARRRIS